MEAHETKLLLNRLKTLTNHPLVKPHTLPCSTGTSVLTSRWANTRRGAVRWASIGLTGTGNPSPTEASRSNQRTRED